MLQFSTLGWNQKRERESWEVKINEKSLVTVTGKNPKDANERIQDIGEKEGGTSLYRRDLGLF